MPWGPSGPDSKTATLLPEKLESELSPQQACLDLAVGLYSSGRVSMGSAAEVARVSISEFQRELGRRRVPVNYDLEELRQDIDALGLDKTDDRRQ